VSAVDGGGGEADGAEGVTDHPPCIGIPGGAGGPRFRAVDVRTRPGQVTACAVAQHASCVRRAMPVFARMCARWLCTVRGEM
jgi:hypothetical protein